MIGQQVQHYRILRQLGAGGMGVVYEAEDTRLGRHVALKMLPERVTSSPEAVERFEREARTLAALNHPNICAIYDIGSHEDQRFIVMELLDGAPLRGRIHGQPLPLEQIVEYGSQLADALDAAHAKGIVHRDVKPANIFITKRGHAKLLDFGIAKLGADQMSHTPADETRRAEDVLTSPGTAVGSINYMSPEQARGEELDGRTDLFSLGVVLYEMATGRQAFAGQTTAVVFDALLNRQPPEPRLTNPEVPDQLQRVILRALEKDRRMRFQTAADMLAELGRIRRDTSGRTAAAPAAPAGTPAAAGASAASGPAAAGAPGAGPGTAYTAASTFGTPAAGTAGTGGAGAAQPAAAGRPRWLVAAGLAVLVLAILGYVMWDGGTPTPAFTERDTVLIADFVNTTGDTVFDDALRQAVSVQLQQTPFVTILPDQQVQRTLRLMQREPDEPVTGAVAREACQRSGAKATVEGSIAPIGSAYVLTLGVHNCETGESLAQEQVQASAKEAVLESLGGAVTTLRQRLGESLASIERYDVPVTDATTASLEALRAYGLGLKARVTAGDDQSIPFFEQAIELDSGFALAHAKLSVVHSNRGRTDPAREHAMKAYELRDRVSEYERLYITWNHAARVLEDPQKVKEALDLIVAAYPRDFSARNNLGVYYMGQARYEEALEQFAVATDIAPGEPLPMQNAAFALLFAGRREESYAMIDRALAIRPSPELAGARWLSAALEDDPREDEYRQQAEQMMPPEILLDLQATLALWRGQLGAFSRLLDERRAHLRAARDDEQLLQVDMRERLTLAAMQRGEALAALRDDLVRGARPTPVRAQVAAILAGLGDVDAVRDVVRELEDEADRLDIRAPMIVARAYILTADDQVADAVGNVEALLREIPQAADLHLHLGLMKQRSGDLEGAARGFQRTIDHVFQVRADVPVLIAKFALAEVRLAQGRTDEARAVIDDLLAQWADADTEFWMLERVREMQAQTGAAR
jgi:tetratricopeptide (TPR) repeat protein/predicted Ser/Thr protein kinase